MKLEKAPASHNLDIDKHILMMSNPNIIELINKVNEEYLYWDKIKYIEPLEGAEASDIWAIANFYRNSSAHYLNFGKYKFRWYLNNAMQKMLHQFDLNIGGSLSAGSLIPKEDKDRYLVSSVMEEAIASSQIEGAVTTRKDAKDMLRKNRSPRNKSEQMILNNYKTIQYILEIKDQPLTLERLLAVHRKIANDTFDE